MRSARRDRRGKRNLVLWLLVPVQLLCAGFFIWDIAVSVFGLRSTPIAWEFRELIEIGAALGLIVGVIVTAWFLWASLRRNAVFEEQLRAASGAFSEVLEERFTDWGLTPAEREVAWLTLKGFSIAEIAGLRETSEGTVKAQSYAIYRKADVSGRTQLLSLFIEDLLNVDSGAGAPAPPAQENLSSSR